MSSDMYAYEQGYSAYFSDCDPVDDNPYDYEDEQDLWNNWCEGFNQAYCEDEGK